MMPFVDHVFAEFMAAFSAVAVITIFTSSPRAGSFTLFDIVLTIVVSFIVGYSWLICGSDHEESKHLGMGK